jgi:hypothetical protein
MEYKRKKSITGWVLLLLLVVFAVASAGINLLLFRDAIFSNLDPESAQEAEVGALYSPYTNSSLDDIIAGQTGRIPILEYHIINSPFVTSNYFMKHLLPDIRKIRRYVVDSDELRNQLDQLQKNGFRNISLDEYLSLAKGEKKELSRIPGNSKLYVLTFDDAGIGQFDFIGTNDIGEPEIDPDCAVGVMIDFAREHPDFKLNAAFCIQFSSTPFQDPKWVTKKLNMLLDLGFELVNHTVSHLPLAKVYRKDPKLVNYEIGHAMELFESHLGWRAASINKICYPEGSISKEVEAMMSNVTWNGKTYHFEAALDAIGPEAMNPNERKFDAYRIGRIETSRFSFTPFVLNAPNLYRTPPLLAKKTNDSGLHDWSPIQASLLPGPPR